MRCSRVIPIVALLTVSTVSIAQQDASKAVKGAESDAKPKAKKDKSAPISAEDIETAKRRSERLFGPDAPLELTLAADFKSAFRSRDTLKVKVTKATLTVKDSSGTPVTVPVEISPRGHFRLRGDVCNFPPVRVVFPKTGLKGTPLAGQNALKLGTHCQTRDKEYSEYPVREHATYKILNMMTDASFRTRLASVTYVQAGEEKDSTTKLGLLIEDEGDMAKRNGARVQTVRGGTFGDMDPTQMAVISVFAYFVGNTDWSLYSLHNIRLLTTADGRYLPVPYDFDWSGAVFTRYARPDPRLGTKTVQERLYRGPCFSQGDLAPILAKYTTQRPVIAEMYAKLPLEDNYRRRVADYYKEFYDVIADQRQIRREFIDACVGRSTS
ncbi:MAG TPA: hypothetical protein VM076_23395 [Gemmatimonadaceae bacterium]|nr:hypothetical protein [Gemmatimonadaceae bacterium]